MGAETTTRSYFRYLFTSSCQGFYVHYEAFFVACRGIAKVPPMAYIPWHPHGIPWRGIGFHGRPWHAMGGTMAAPAATARAPSTALHGNLTACNGNPHGTPNVHGT